ncbi:delta6 fatty acid desaturase [Neoconidiobolus thromboides FSU 785]|nr:delta6 fatty acid desaturase [Neoconidiobolus thromboides FSU 785]
MPPFVTEAKQNNSDDKIVTIINGKVYDITDFINEHPGGPVIKTQIGIDATDTFNAFHPPNIQEILTDYYDEELTKQYKLKGEKDNEFLKEIRNLKKDFEKEGLFKSNKPFYLMIGVLNISIFLSSVIVLKHFGHTLIGVLISALLMGLFWQQCGWHAHEYLHHQVFENRYLNNTVGGLFFGAVCQGFSPSWWKDKHNTHHASPNVHNDDPDIDTHPFLAWSENVMELYTELDDQELGSQMKLFMLNNQKFLFFPLLAFARLSWCFFSLWYSLSNGQLGDKKKQFIPISPIEPLCLVLHWVINFFIAFYYPTTWIKSLLFLFFSQTSSGVLIAAVFSLNHNGMRILTKDEANELDFYQLQIETGRDVIPSYFMTWFTGGLNYQIEHHLFPTLPRHNFQFTQKRVQALCNKYDIKYHCTGFFEGTMEVMDRLDRVSKMINSKLHLD